MKSRTISVRVPENMLLKLLEVYSLKSPTGSYEGVNFSKAAKWAFGEAIQRAGYHGKEPSNETKAIYESLTTRSSSRVYETQTQTTMQSDFSPFDRFMSTCRSQIPQEMRHFKDSAGKSKDWIDTIEQVIKYKEGKLSLVELSAWVDREIDKLENPDEDETPEAPSEYIQNQIKTLKAMKSLIQNKKSQP